MHASSKIDDSSKPVIIVNNDNSKNDDNNSQPFKSINPTIHAMKPIKQMNQ